MQMILSYTPKSQEQMYIILPPKEINSHTNGERQGETTPIQTFYAITRIFILVKDLHFCKKFTESKRKTLSFLALRPNAYTLESHPWDGGC